jgi:hypothetical protein
MPALPFPKLSRFLLGCFVTALCAHLALAQGQAMRHGPKGDLATGAAFAPDGSLWVTGLDADKHLFVQHASGRPLGAWSAPQLLDTGDDEITADGESRPKLAFGPKGWAVISYTMPLEKPYTGFIRILRSADGGKTFSPPVTVHQDRQPITHRFESIAFDRQGVLHTLWVDKRDQPPKGSGVAYAGAAIYRNTSLDGGATFGPDTKLADHSCECCRIALAADPNGELQAVWRHVFGEQTRDHAFAKVSEPTPNHVTRASYDDWQIKACPHHGPGLAPAQGLNDPPGYHFVWFGVRKVRGQDVAAVRYARLDAQGAPIAQTVRALPDDKAEHADVMADGPRVAVVWRSTEGAKTSLKAWLSKDSGKNFSLTTLAQTDGINDHPRLAQQGPRMVVVWRLPQEIQVHELDF